MARSKQQIAVIPAEPPRTAMIAEISDESIRKKVADLLWTSSNASTKQLHKAIRAGHARFTAGLGTLKTVAIGIGIPLHALKARLPKGEWESHFEAHLSSTLGISFRTAQRYMAEARPYLVIEGEAARPESAAQPRRLHGPAGAAKPDDDWLTPEDILAGAREYLGAIDFDPCASPAAPSRIAKSFCLRSEGADGLAEATRWKGNIWAAPGCRANRAAEWLSKATADLKAGHLKEALLFLPGSPEPPEGPIARLREPATLSLSVAPDSRSAVTRRRMDIHLVSLDPDLARFARAFRSLAVVLVPFRDSAPADDTTSQPGAG